MAGPWEEFQSKPGSEEKPWEQFGATPEKPKGLGAIRKAGDLAVGLVGGAVGATKALTDVAGAGNAASNFLDSANKDIDSLLSPQAQADKQEQAAIMKEAEGKGTYEGVKAGLKAFSVAPVQTTMSGLGSVIPVAAATLATGGGAIPAMAAGAATGAAMGAGTVKGAIYDDIKERSLAAGMTPEAAEAAATKAQSYGGGNTDQIALGAGLGMLDAATGVTPIVANMARKAVGREAVQALTTNTGKGLLQRTATGAIEEIPLEAAQGGQEQLATNIAAQRAGYQAGTWDNVASNATLEGLASAGPGAGFGALSGGAKPAPPAMPPTAEDAATQGDPLRLKHDPMAGTHTVFPDGSVVLNSESSNGAQTVRDMQRATRLERAALGDLPPELVESFERSRADAREKAGLWSVLPVNEPAKPSEKAGIVPTAEPSLTNAGIFAMDTGLTPAPADPLNTPLTALGLELSKTNQRLRAEADALGLDTDGLMGDAARMTDGKPHEDYLMAANDQLRKAMKAAKEIPHENEKQVDEQLAKEGVGAKLTDSKTGEENAPAGAGPGGSGAVRPSNSRVGEHGQRATGTDSGGLPGTVAPKANGNAETTPSAPAAPAAGLPAAGSSTVQAAGVNGKQEFQIGGKDPHTRTYDHKRDGRLVRTVTYPDGQSATETLVTNKKGDELWVSNDRYGKGEFYPVQLSLDQAETAIRDDTADKPLSSKPQPQGALANVPQPAQPGTQASPAPSAQGAAPASGDASSPVAPIAPTSPEKQKALDRIASGKAWFGSGPKAQQFIAQNGLNDTHQAVKSSDGKRWDVIDSKTIASNQDPTPGQMGQASEQADMQALPPVQAAKLQEAHKTIGRGVTRKQVQSMRDRIAKEANSGQTNNGGVIAKLNPLAIGKRMAQIARLDSDLALFDEAKNQPTQGATREPQAQETVTPEPGSEAPAAAADTVGKPAWSGAPIENLQQLAKQKRSSARAMRNNASVAQERGDSIQSKEWMDQAKDADKIARLIQEEIERRSNQQAEAQRPQEPAAAASQPVAARSVHIEAGEAAYAKGDPRVLPSYFTKPGDKNSKDWFKGWDTAKSAAGESQSASTSNPKIKAALDKKNEAAPVAAPEVQGTNPVTDQKTQETPKQTQQATEPTAEQIAAIGDITIEVPTETGTAKMTVNATKALAAIDERMDALEMVQRCLA